MEHAKIFLTLAIGIIAALMMLACRGNAATSSDDGDNSVEVNGDAK